LNPGSFHAAQMRIYFSEMVLFLGNGIISVMCSQYFYFLLIYHLLFFFFLARMILGHPMMQDS
jgi:hypothetical protein